MSPYNQYIHVVVYPIAVFRVKEEKLSDSP